MTSVGLLLERTLADCGQLSHKCFESTNFQVVWEKSWKSYRHKNRKRVSFSPFQTKRKFSLPGEFLACLVRLLQTEHISFLHVWKRQESSLTERSNLVENLPSRWGFFLFRSHLVWWTPNKHSGKWKKGKWHTVDLQKLTMRISFIYCRYSYFLGPLSSTEKIKQNKTQTVVLKIVKRYITFIFKSNVSLGYTKRHLNLVEDLWFRLLAFARWRKRLIIILN